jgi:integrase
MGLQRAPPDFIWFPHILTLLVRTATRDEMTTRSLNKLTPKGVETAPDGNHSDGGNLHLCVRDNGRLRSWIFRYTVNGRTREMGLGALAAVPLKKAREERDRLRRLIDEGHDPLAESRANRDRQANKKSFVEVAEAVIALRTAKWKGGTSSTSLAAWRRTLLIEAEPLHNLPVDEITTTDVKRVVATKWAKGHCVEAKLALNRLATTFAAAKANGWRTGDNPASWEIFVHLSPSRPQKDRHHPALAWKDAPAFMERLRTKASMAALALEFLILTGVRLNEAVQAQWDEIDFTRTIWTVPPARMKRGQEHLVPLSTRAAAILNGLYEHRGRSRFIFSGARAGRPISDAAVKDMCRRLTDGEASPHGFRATLRSWCSDHGVEFQVAENILAHSKQGVVAAYDRSTMVERRRPVMQAWANFLDQKDAGAEVVPLKRQMA